MLSEKDIQAAFEIGKNSPVAYFHDCPEFMALMRGEGPYVRPPDDKRALIDEYHRGQVAGVLECAEGIDGLDDPSGILE